MMGKKRSSTSLPFDYSSSSITGIRRKKGKRKRSCPDLQTDCDNFKKLCLIEKPVCLVTQSGNSEQSCSSRSANSIVKKLSSKNKNLHADKDNLSPTADIVNVMSSGNEAFGVKECSVSEPSFNSFHAAQDTDTTNAKITDEEIDEIIDGLDKDLELLLDVRPMKSQLTPQKIKRILRHIISNKHVLAMVEKTMDNNEEEKEKDGDDGSQKETASEPKLKRLRAKQLKEKQTAFPQSLTVIPLKTTEETQPCFKNMVFKEFSDNGDSSDSEYSPGMEELQSGEEEISNTETKEDCKVSALDSDLSSSAIADSGYGSNDSNNDQGIALRTRSKLSLVTTPSKYLGLVSPDITHNVHDSDHSTKVWLDFLKSLSNPLDEKCALEEDDEDDPDYISTLYVHDYLEDLESNVDDELQSMNEIPDETTSDKSIESKCENSNQGNESGELEQTNHSVSVSHPTNIEEHDVFKKAEEPHSWLTSLENLQQICTNLDNITGNNLLESKSENANQESEVGKPMQADYTASVSLPTPIEEIIPYVQLKESESWFSPLERLQLEHQMRMHVQLLCQSFLLSYGINQFSKITSSSIKHLEQLAMLNRCSQQTLLGNLSSFYACNLDEALDIVKMVQEDEYFTNRFQNVDNDISSTSEDVMGIIAHSKVFIYPDLLPTRFYSFPMKKKGDKKTSFTAYEDNLIAMGLEEFFGTGHRYKYIHSLLLPSKTVIQIMNRIKNMRSRKHSDNPIKKYFITNEWPRVPRYTAPFNPLCVIPPSSMPIGVLPSWMSAYVTPSMLIAVPQMPILKQKRKYTHILPKGVPPKKHGTIAKPKKKTFPSGPTSNTSVQALPNPVQGLSEKHVRIQPGVICKSLVFKHQVRLRPIAKAPPKKDESVKSEMVTTPSVPNSDANAEFKPKPVRNVDSNAQFKPKSVQNVNTNDQLKPKSVQNVNMNAQFKPKSVQNVNTNAQFKPKSVQNVNTNHKISPSRKPMSDIWCYFIKDRNGGKCTICNTRIAMSRGYNGNLRRHLKLMHPTMSIRRTNTRNCSEPNHSTSDLSVNSKQVFLKRGHQSTPLFPPVPVPIAKAPSKKDKSKSSLKRAADRKILPKPKFTITVSKQPCDSHTSANCSESSIKCSEKSIESPHQVTSHEQLNIAPLNIKTEPFDPGYADSDNNDVKVSLNSNCSGEAVLESNIETDDADNPENNIESLCLSVPYIKIEPPEDSGHCMKTGSSTEWTKEEDYIVVDSCERYGLNMDAFMVAAAAISTKTVAQVKDRFFELMELTDKKNQDSDR